MKFKKGERVCFTNDVWKMKTGIVVKECGEGIYEIAFPDMYVGPIQIPNGIYEEWELEKDPFEA